MWITSCLNAVTTIENIRHVHSLVNLALEYSSSGALEWRPIMVEDALHLAVNEEASDLVDLLLEGGVIPNSKAINASLMKEDFHLFHRFLKRIVQWSLVACNCGFNISSENGPVLMRLKDHIHILQTLHAQEGVSLSCSAKCAVEQDDFDGPANSS